MKKCFDRSFLNRFDSSSLFFPVFLFTKLLRNAEQNSTFWLLLTFRLLQLVPLHALLVLFVFSVVVPVLRLDGSAAIQLLLS